MDEEITCAICQKSLDNVNDVVTLREKGSEGINRASTERNDLIQTVPGQKVHQTCRREYCHPSYINRAKKKERESSISSSRSLDRKTEQSFTFKTDCFFCGTNVDLEDQKRRQGMCSGRQPSKLNILCCRPVLKGRTNGRKWYEPEYYMFMICQQPMLFIIKCAA